MRFKVDENVPVACVEQLRAEGHDALSVLDQGLGGAPDPCVAQVCRAEERVLLSLDLGFADIRSYPPSEGAGGIVPRLRTQEASALCRVVEGLLPVLGMESPVGKLWVVEEHRVRIREGGQTATANDAVIADE